MSKDDKPRIAPLREITWRASSRKGDRRAVRLECGHDSHVPASGYPARTRCYMCLDDAVRRWDAAHTCEHGVVEPRPCVDCLEAEIARLKAEIKRLGGGE